MANYYPELNQRIENIDSELERKHDFLVNEIRELLTEVQELTVRVRRLEKEQHGKNKNRLQNG